jgi:hypothetical protein
VLGRPPPFLQPPAASPLRRRRPVLRDLDEFPGLCQGLCHFSLVKLANDEKTDFCSYSTSSMVAVSSSSIADLLKEERLHYY